MKTAGIALGLAFGLCLTACVPAPRLNYTAEQLGEIDSLEELMRVAYADSKAVWPLEKKEPLGEPDFEALQRVGARLEAVASVTAEKFGPMRPEGFAELARRMGGDAGRMREAGQAKDVSSARAAVKALGETCDACHKQFK
jgi:hypothetical protein